MLRKRIFLLILYIFFNVHLKPAYSKIFDKNIQDPEEVLNRYRNTIDNRKYRNYDDIELISKALEIIEQEKRGITAAKINECLSIYFGNTKNKFDCIKKLIYKGIKAENIYSKPYYYVNFSNEYRLPNKYKQKFDNQFKDSKSSEENEAKRAFQTTLHFSKDYLDVNDLLRTDTKITESPVQINNRVHIISYLVPINNAVNDLEFRDFSQDYLDTNDLLRTNTKMVEGSSKQMKNTQNDKHQYKLTPSKNEVDYSQDMSDYTKTNFEKLKEIKKNKRIYVFKLMPNKKEQKSFRKFGNIIPKDDFIKKKILRMNFVESDSSSSSDESKSEEKKVKSKNIKGKDKKPKRFQVIDKSVADISSEEADNGNESDIPIQRPIEIPVKKKGAYYMQAPSRIFKIRNEGRRRLPHFFPKRYHWDEDDMRNLQYQWFTGRQGKYWGQYKTPY